MKTESAATSVMLALIRKARPVYPLVWKINDRMTGGIPDCQIITDHAVSCFVEVKKASSERQAVETLLTERQRLQLAKFWRTGVPSLVVVHRPSGWIEAYVPVDYRFPAFSERALSTFTDHLLRWLETR